MSELTHEELRAESKRLERSCEELVDERDDAEQALSQAYYLVTGHSPEWSNKFGKQHALNDIEDSVNLLKESVKIGRQQLSTLKAILEKKDEALGRIGVTLEVNRLHYTEVVYPAGQNQALPDRLQELISKALSLTPETYVKEEDTSTMADKPKEEL